MLTSSLRLTDLHRIVGPNREVYLRNQADHGVSPADCVTEVQFPVARA